MNKKLKQMATQAGFDLVAAESAYNGHILPNSLSRFSNLIIQDCLEILRTNGYDDAATTLEIKMMD